jgi:lipoprotein-releasing system ATP-binding protein
MNPTINIEDNVLSARGLVKSYRKDRLEVPVLRGVDLDLERGKFTAMVGRSGSGKSTLLHLLASLDSPDAGEIYFGDTRIDNASKARRDLYRNRDIGVIFQFYHLLPELSALENVMIPAMIERSMLHYFRSRRTLKERAKSLLDRVGLGHRMKHKPTEMSGGEMQRTAIARALMLDPKILLADEPTGNLDSQTGHQILTLLRDLNVNENLTIAMVTHDDAVAQKADRTILLESGLVVTKHRTTAA